jgi:uncharacterized OB-fold protein
LTEEKLYGSRCLECGHRIIPPRAFCVKCLSPKTAYVEVGSGGFVETWTVSDGITWIYVKFPEVDGGLLHMLDPASKPVKGLRVKPVFREHRVGSILDIKWFTEMK